MIISLNWLKKYTDIDMPIGELATLIGARLVEIEKVTSNVGKYNGAVIARVVECEPLENSDHLNVTKIDDGGVTQDVERDENGLVQVVCGAPNVKASMTVVWLAPGSTVPSTYSDDEPFVLGSRNLRGVMSNGMLASAKELDLFEDHTGILEITDGIAAGTNLADAFELDDYLLDIENKSLTHRPDTFGIVGFAREVAAIAGKQFVTPEWLQNTTPDYGEKSGDQSAPSVAIDDPELSGRYQAIIMTSADASRQSPLEVQTYLARVGMRPINAVVDVTNYLMMLTGQPLHAFDYDKVVAVSGGDPTIHVRAGREGEQLELLDGRTITLDQADIVIAAGETAIGLAGAMGGANTVIDDTTKNIIIESATFNLYNLRTTQMRHGIFSEAITRFTKGQPAALTAPVLAEAVRLMAEWSGAVRVSDVADSYPGKQDPTKMTVDTQRVNNVLGSHFDTDDIVQTLSHTEFAVNKIDDDTSEVTAPYWRSDIHIFEDIVEEIGRLNGFDSIVPSLPKRDFTAVRPNDFDELRAKIRDALVRAGGNEVLTYSFVHGDVLKKADQIPTDSYRITNSLSPDLQYYRQSITPSLLGLVNPNVKSGYDHFALFEINKTHSKTAKLVENGVPAELHRVGLVVTNKTKQAAAPYFEAKRILSYLASVLELDLEYKAFPDDTSLAFTKPFELRRSARVMDKKSGQSIGIVGEYKKSVARNFKLPDHSAGFELLPEAIELALQHATNSYVPLSRFPSSERDICFQVGREISYQQIVDAAHAALATVDVTVALSPVDIYQPDAGDVKNITIRLRLTSDTKTLTSDEVAKVSDAVIEAVTAATQATVV